MSWDDQVAMTSCCQGGKAGGDAYGSAGTGASALAGDGMGYGSARVNYIDPIGTGEGLGGSATAGARGVGAMGGDVSDNTKIGSININS